MKSDDLVDWTCLTMHVFNPEPMILSVFVGMVQLGLILPGLSASVIASASFKGGK